ncbi:MAG: 4-phosphopantetheinyl transferase superfamily, partial [Bacteroidota bacterium]
KKFLSEEELAQLNSMDQHLRISNATLYWSLKESFYKWWGNGGLDFSKDMSIEQLQPNQSGRVLMRFSKMPDEEFQMQYHQHDNLWITWISK